MNQLCQMPLVLSIIAMTTAHTAMASPLTQCPALSVQVTCDTGTPALHITRGARGAQLALSIGAVESGGPLGDSMIHLISGSKQGIAPLKTLPTTPLPLAIIGTEGADGDACCLRRMTVSAPHPSLCSADPLTESDPLPDGPELPPTSLPDIGIDMSVDPICPEGASGHTCSGTLTLTSSGSPTGPFPAMIEHSLQDELDVVISGPLPCYDVGPAAQLCREDAQILGSGLSLPVSLNAPPSLETREIEVCAELTLPKSPSQTLFLIQTALTQLGYDIGEIDGKTGPNTLAAAQGLAARFDLVITDPLDRDFQALLGLAPYSDANPDNNRICATTTLPARPRPKVPRLRAKPEQPRDRVPPARSNSVSELVCDPASTVKRGSDCACRFTQMTKVSPVACVCSNGTGPSATGCP